MLRLRNIDNGLKHHEFYSERKFHTTRKLLIFSKFSVDKKRQIDFDKII